MFDAFLQPLIENGFAQLFAYVAKMGGLAALVVFVIEYATRAKWFPFLDQDTSDKAKRFVAVFAAAASAVGLSVSYNGAAEQLIINGFSPHRLSLVAVAVASQFGLQQMLFNFIIKRYMR